MTGRYWDDSEEIDERLHRGLIVQEFHEADIDALDYIRRSKGWD